MALNWMDAFSQAPRLRWKDGEQLEGVLHAGNLEELKEFLDLIHAKFCLLRPYFETRNYPLVEARELLPTFEVDLYEHKQLPGFSMVALERPIQPFDEIFQFDRLYSLMDLPEMTGQAACPLHHTIVSQNVQVFKSRLPRVSHADFMERFGPHDIVYLEQYPALLQYLLQLERCHVMSLDKNGEFYLSGIFGSLPSDLDAEIKRFGLKIKKFRPGDHCLYERNRLFVYNYLMELHGFPIVSERRTSAAMFARRLFKTGERFLVRVLGQSDRTITTLWSHAKARYYPRVEKMALVALHPEQKESIQVLKKGGFFVDEKRRVVLLRIIYRQHRYNPLNVREDRAMSAVGQEIIHPITGEVLRDLNIIKDTSSMLLRLTDIVRGEYTGAISFKRQEIVEETDTHDKRLKFLYAWLTKHQRRIISYSDEFYGQVVRVLDSYLLNPDNFDLFNDLHDLYQEVWARYSYIQQARKVMFLEDLLDRDYRGRRITYQEQLKIAVDLLGDLKFEIVNYFEDLIENILAIGEQFLNDRYILRNYAERTDEELSSYGLTTKRHYEQLAALVEEFKTIRKTRREPPHVYELNENW